MNPETLKALDESIEHWKKNAAAKTKRESSVFANRCALCQRFRSDEYGEPCEREDGEKCPVYIATGYTLCEESPYVEAAEIWFSTMSDESLPQPVWREAAQAEESFLRALRPASED
jgi:hypothetical protein